MGEDSKIAWTHHTFNPWWGCTRVSPGCTNCYAEQLATVRRKLAVWGATADRKPMSEAYWKQPAKWNRDAAEAGERRRVFCASMADVFEFLGPRANRDAHAIEYYARNRLWEMIEATPHLDWLLLTKRPQNVAGHVPWHCGDDRDVRAGWPANVWLGVTAEDQKRADERIPILLNIPARVRFVSYEPALGPIDFLRGLGMRGGATHGQLVGMGPPEPGQTGIDWIIVGGESGPRARPFNLNWAYFTIAQCKAAGAACFVKQMGSYPTACACRVRLRDPKGGDPEEWQAPLRVREFPR